MPPVCRECGNDEGSYDGLCLDCLETPPPATAAVLLVKMPTRDELRAMAEIGRRTEGRGIVVST